MVLFLVMFGFNLSKPNKEDISILIEEALKGEIVTQKIESNAFNKIGCTIDGVIVKVKDKLFEKNLINKL